MLVPRKVQYPWIFRPCFQNHPKKNAICFVRQQIPQALEGELAPLFRTKLRIFAMDGLAAGHGALKRGCGLGGG